MSRNFRGEETTEGLDGINYCPECGSVLVSVQQFGPEEYRGNCGCTFETNPLGGDEE